MARNGLVEPFWRVGDWDFEIGWRAILIGWNWVTLGYIGWNWYSPWLFSN